MIIKGVRSILAVIILVLLCQVFDVFAEETKPDTSSQTESEPLVTSNIPNLAEIVPLEIQLIDRLKDLQKQLEGKIDNEQAQKSYAELEGDLRVLSERLDKLKAVQEYKYNKLVDLHEVLKNKHNALQSLNEPVSLLIRKLSAQRKEWQTEANLWSEWQNALLNEGEFEQLRAAFDRAAEAIKTASELILSELSTLLEKQERAGAIERQIDTLINDVDSLVAKERQITLFNVTPPMFSTQYLSQLSSENVWGQVVASFDLISLPDKKTVSQHGWIVVLQVVITLLLIVSILKRKKIFEAKKRWHFLALYPISTGVFLSYLLCLLVYEYQGVPHFWKVVATIIGGTAFARLMRGVADEYWKAWAIYLLVGIVLIEGLLDAMSFPIPLYRLYICIAALTILIFCLSLAAKLKNEHKNRIYLWLLYPGAMFYTGIIFLEIWGRKALAAYLFVSLIDTIITILAFVFFLYMIHGCIEWLFNTPLLRRSAVLDDDETNIIIKRLTRFFDALVILLVITPATLTIWSVYQNLTEATEGVLNSGFNLGDNRVTVGLLLIAAATLVGSFLLSWIVQKLLIDQVLFQRRMEKGSRISIARLVHYSIVVVGFVFAIAALGIEITKLTIIISALGVGIGFGLQGIVNNFVSGLVLLFEQPIRVGDLIELQGMWAEIKHIGIRSTIVRNFDHADVIIPNADLVSNQVTNWTLADRQARLTIAVGVAYGSNVDLVIETLMGCARANDQVVESPGPLALFLNFGESTLDFELRVFVPASLRVGIRSMLHREIDKRFREEGITIAFPQRDINLPGITIQGSTEKNDRVTATVYKDDES